MSAWIVSRAHIDAMVQVLCEATKEKVNGYPSPIAWGLEDEHVHPGTITRAGASNQDRTTTSDQEPPA